MASGVRDGDAEPQRAPLGQRIYDNWMLLMVLGIVIMAVVYTGWGLLEVATMPRAELP